MTYAIDIDAPVRCKTCRHIDHLDRFEVAGMPPDRVLCPGCGDEVEIEDVELVPLGVPPETETNGRGWRRRRR